MWTAFVAVACVAAWAVATYAARDGGEPPRARAEASPRGIEAGPAHAATAPVPRGPGPSARAAATSAPAPAASIEALEMELATSDADGRDLVLARMLPDMVVHDPQAIARFAERETDPKLRELLMRQLAQLWAATDGDAALAWSQSLPDAAERDAAVTDIALTTAATDPARAVAMRERYGSSDAPDTTLEVLAQLWAAQDFDAALAWTNAQPSGLQREGLLQRLAFERAQAGSPADAALLANEMLEDGGLKADAIATIAQQWSLRDRDAASAWVAQLPDALRERAAAEINGATEH